MKKIVATSLLLAIICQASLSVASPEPVEYCYEITPTKGDPMYTTLTLNSKLPPRAVREMNQRTLEYVSSISSMPAAQWAQAVKAKLLPKHDWLKCDHDTCWYGTKGVLHEGISVSISLELVDQQAITALNVNYVHASGFKQVKASKDSPVSLELPASSVCTYFEKSSMQVGDSMSLGSGCESNRPLVTVRRMPQLACKAHFRDEQPDVKVDRISEHHPDLEMRKDK